MKKILLLFTLLISHFSFAQLNVYNDVLIDEIPNELLEYNDTKIYFDNQKSRLHFTKENDYTANSILAETQIILTVGFSKVDPNMWPPFFDYIMDCSKYIIILFISK